MFLFTILRASRSQIGKCLRVWKREPVRGLDMVSLCCHDSNLKFFFLFINVNFEAVYSRSNDKDPLFTSGSS